MTWTSYSPLTTKKFAKLFAKEILRYKPRNRAFVIGLRGELGTGKTTFVQGLARGLGIRKSPQSPTFLLLRHYKLSGKNYRYFFHADAYRIKKSSDFSALGFDEILTRPENIVVIEWAEKIKRLLPKKIIWIEFRHGRKTNERVIKIKI
jgi:tRNA threonylcarbamoyladenosine biosynthesis protein TsaE